MEMQKTTIRLPKKLLVTTKKVNKPNQGRQHATDLLNHAEKLTKTDITGPSDLASNIDTYLYGNE